MENSPKILVGTLYSGESQFEDCIDSLQSQSYKKWNQKIFKHLSNKEGHDTLYDYFMDNSNDFDLFIKLDADMVLLRETCLEEIISLFQSDYKLSHLESVVQDYLTDSLMMGLHVFRSHVKWRKSNERLFDDRKPVLEGDKVDLRQSPAPFVVHNPNPTNYQAFHFGVHRALKALQPGRFLFRISQYNSQSRVLNTIWDNYARSKNIKQGFAALGAYLVFKDEIPKNMYDYTNPKLHAEFLQKYSTQNKEDLFGLMNDFWLDENNLFRKVRRRILLHRILTKPLRTINLLPK